MLTFARASLTISCPRAVEITKPQLGKLKRHFAFCTPTFEAPHPASCAGTCAAKPGPDPTRQGATNCKVFLKPRGADHCMVGPARSWLLRREPGEGKSGKFSLSREPATTSENVLSRSPISSSPRPPGGPSPREFDAKACKRAEQRIVWLKQLSRWHGSL